MKRALADVLWDAANEQLCIGAHGFSRYTCDAIAYAAGSGHTEKVLSFLRQLGFPSDGYDRFDLFGQFKAGEKRQGVRYMWLLLAMHVAEDEGIEIEVSA